MEETRIMLKGLAPENFEIKRISNKLATMTKDKTLIINPEIVKALMPEKHFQPASKHKPIITLRNKKTGEITGHEENRFNKDYYDRELFKDSGYHTKVAITNPENVDKVKDFEKETFGKKRKTSK